MNADSKIPALTIGRKGENGVESHIFDISVWQQKYGEGTPVLLIQRPGDSVIYPAILDVNGSIATWTVSNIDTAKKGIGRCTLQYLAGDKVKKSNTFMIVVQDALSANSTAPAPYSDYVAQVVENAQAAAESAESAAESAQIASTYKARLIDGVIHF